MFPDVVDRALLGMKEIFIATEVAARLAVHLASEIWDDPAFVLRWFECGLPFLRNVDLSLHNEGDLREPVFREEWKANEEICLLIAKH